MGLEVATFVSGLTPTWPTSTDQKVQGDDHIRLLKAVLQATFPNADRAFRFPKALSKTANYTVLSTDDGAIILVDTSAGNVTLTLPTLPATFFNLSVMKITADANTVSVSGTVNGGSLAALTQQWQNIEIFGNGSAYYGLIFTAGEIASNSVALAKLVNAGAQGRIIGRKTSSSGAWEDCTLSEIFNTIASVARGDLWVRGASAWDRLAIGAAYTGPASNGTDLVAAYPRQPLFHLQERQADGQLGTAISSGWQKRPLNTTVTNEIPSASVSSSVISLLAGTYAVEAFLSYRNNQAAGIRAQSRLRNTSDSTTLVLGRSVSIPQESDAEHFLSGRFTLAGTKNIEVQTYQSSSGLTGNFSSAGETEVYADVQIRKLA